MPANQRHLKLSDPELLALIMDDKDYLSIVYKQSKEYCLRFMRNMTSRAQVREEDLQDIYQDAVLILYEKILAGNFTLSSSFQTYLNSVCRYQLLKRLNIGISNIAVDPDELRELQFDPDVKDELQEQEIMDHNRFLALGKALMVMREESGKCYGLLSQFWYHGKSIRDLAAEFGYESEKSAKTAKHKCVKRLRLLAGKLNTQQK